MESIDSLSGLESLRRPPGTGWPPRLPIARDLGLGDGHRGSLFRDELRRAGPTDAIDERSAGAAEHSDRIARRRAGREGGPERAERERTTGPQEKETRRAAERRVEREETREDVGPEAGRPVREAPPASRAGREARPRAASEPAPAAADERPPAPVPGAAPAPAPGAGASVGRPAPAPGAAPAAPAARAAGRPDGGPGAPAAERGPAARPARPAPPAPPEPADTRRAAEVLEQLKAAIKPGLRQAVVRLDPAELGAVTIRVAVGRGGVQGRIEVESRETLELLERHAPELRAALESVGLELGELELALTEGERRDPRGAEPEPTAPRRRAAAADDEPDFRPAARRLRLAADAVDVDA